MSKHTLISDSSGTTDSSAPGATMFRPDPARIERAIRRRSVAVLATASPAQRPHAATVLYQAAAGALYTSTMRESRKARNIAANPYVGVVIPVRRLPIGPPSTIQFQASATILATDDPGIRALVAAGELGAVTGHGELDLVGGCFIRIALPPRLITYGLGMSLWRLIRNPLDASGVVELA